MAANSLLLKKKPVQRSTLKRTPLVINDYKSIAARGPLLDKVYSLRYKSYSAENYIEKNASARFMDEYDKEKNNTSYLTFFRGKPIGSIRGCVYNPATRDKLPVMQPFGAEIEEHLGHDRPFVEANRFVVDPTFQRRGGIKARFNIFRSVVEQAFRVEATHILAAVREEHAKFYRILFFEQMVDCEPKPYPGLKFRVVLLACHDLVRLKKLIWSKIE